MQLFPHIQLFEFEYTEAHDSHLMVKAFLKDDSNLVPHEKRSILLFLQLHSFYNIAFVCSREIRVHASFQGLK